MATFPLLKSGAVSQYPAGLTRSQSSQAMYFLDGSDQRFPTRGKTLRQWHIDLSMLDEEELETLEAFFAAQYGEYSVFDFLDPHSGSVIANCRFGQEILETCVAGPDNGTADFWIVETNG